MTMLAFVNLIALALLFGIALRVLRDYDQQHAAGIRDDFWGRSAAQSRHKARSHRCSAAPGTEGKSVAGPWPA